MDGPVTEGMIRSERRAGVTLLTIARPEKANALTPAMATQLSSELDAAAAEGASCVVLTGAGPDFCAGADLEWAMADRRRPRAERVSGPQPVLDLVVAVARSRVPVVAAVSGRARGGGVALASACAMVVATEAADFALPEAALGVFPAEVVAGLGFRLGEQVAFRLGLLGEVVSAGEARSIGLVDRVVAGDPVADALAWARRAAATPALLEAAASWRRARFDAWRPQLRAARILAAGHVQDESRQGGEPGPPDRSGVT